MLPKEEPEKQARLEAAVPSLSNLDGWWLQYFVFSCLHQTHAAANTIGNADLKRLIQSS
jgi:hypothetical protein